MLKYGKDFLISISSILFLKYYAKFSLAFATLTMAGFLYGKANKVHALRSNVLIGNCVYSALIYSFMQGEPLLTSGLSLACLLLHLQ